MVYDLDDGINRLIPLLMKNKLVIFTGSGISIDSNLPTWDDLIKRFIVCCRIIEELLPESERIDNLYDEAIIQADKYPTRVASVLKERIKLAQSNHDELNINGVFRDFLTDTFSAKKPNQNHHLIVKTNYPYIITSNYDNLLEIAAMENGYTQLRFSSYSFKNASKVASAIYTGRSAIIHIHGDANDIAVEDLVFTSEDYVKIKRKYAGFTLALQTIFINYSVLFIGYGGSDPHLEDFMEEISYLIQKPETEGLPRYFVVLKHDKINHILNKYKETLRTDIIRLQDYSETRKLLLSLQNVYPRSK